MNQNITAIRLFAVVFLVIFSGQGNGFAQDKPEYLQSFDPAKGFKPAQADLTEIYLQIAGSLEYYGSPVPYMQHMKAEHLRIQAKYQQKFGGTPKSYLPANMTDQYLDRYISNWNVLSPKLGLNPYAQDVGHMMRLAIKGTWNTGTIVVDIFNQHQAKVFSAMSGKSDDAADFDALKSELVKRLELDNENVNEEKYEVPRRDAISFAFGIKGVTMKLFKRLDESLIPEDAQKIERGFTAMLMDIGRMAESELEAAIAERALDNQLSAAKP
jgi:hypothetical protein